MLLYCLKFTVVVGDFFLLIDLLVVSFCILYFLMLFLRL